MEDCAVTTNTNDLWDFSESVLSPFSGLGSTRKSEGRCIGQLWIMSENKGYRCLCNPLLDNNLQGPDPYITRDDTWRHLFPRTLPYERVRPMRKVEEATCIQKQQQNTIFSGFLNTQKPMTRCSFSLSSILLVTLWQSSRWRIPSKEWIHYSVPSVNFCYCGVTSLVIDTPGFSFRQKIPDRVYGLWALLSQQTHTTIWSFLTDLCPRTPPCLSILHTFWAGSSAVLTHPQNVPLTPVLAMTA